VAVKLATNFTQGSYYSKSKEKNTSLPTILMRRSNGLIVRGIMGRNHGKMPTFLEVGYNIVEINFWHQNLYIQPFYRSNYSHTQEGNQKIQKFEDKNYFRVFLIFP